jgi:hypothetical protein
MSYNLMIEFHQAVEWLAVHEAATRYSMYVDYFPISGIPEALGVCLPFKGAHDEGWKELRSLLLAVSALPGSRIIDMYSGVPVARGEIESLRDAVLGG